MIMEGQEKRLLLVIGVSFLFLFLYYTYFLPTPPAPVPPASTAEQATAAATPPPTAQIGSGSALAVAGKPALAPSVIAPLGESAEREVKVVTPLFQAVLSNRGGALRSFTLARYSEKMAADAPRVEMVRAPLPESPALATELAGMGGPLGLSRALFLVEGTNLSLAAGETGAVTFRTRTAEGLEVEKTLTFSADSYLVEVKTTVINRGAAQAAVRASLDWGPGLEPLPGSKTPVGDTGAAYSVGGKVETVKGKKLTGPLDYSLPSWTGTRDLYFLAALLPVGKDGFDGGHAALGPDGRVGMGLHAALQLAPGASRTLTARAFLGPKEMELLKQADPSLAGAIDLGWFSIIAKPLLYLLNWLYRFLGNYGLAIIVLAVFLKVIFIPFNNISFKSMRKMSALQPRINALREKFKKDPQKLNEEIMRLYQENKVNPAAGCLPILLQIPVFVALYRVLAGAIELRHAPFTLWITDLSSKDPFYVTPILMGATMFLQQKMTPVAGDPRQAQIMLFLPIIFTAMFLSLPSGLVLYWLVTNVLSIAHQWWMLRSADGAVPAKA